MSNMYYSDLNCITEIMSSFLKFQYDTYISGIIIDMVETHNEPWSAVDIPTTSNTIPYKVCALWFLTTLSQE